MERKSRGYLKLRRCPVFLTFGRGALLSLPSLCLDPVLVAMGLGVCVLG